MPDRPCPQFNADIALAPALARTSNLRDCHDQSSTSCADAAWRSLRPSVDLIVFAYVAAWLVFEPETFDWHGIATIVVWIMTLFIQRAENRDTQSSQAKLDELLQHTAWQVTPRRALTRRSPKISSSTGKLRGRTIEGKRGLLTVDAWSAHRRSSGASLSEL